VYKIKIAQGVHDIRNKKCSNAYPFYPSQKLT